MKKNKTIFDFISHIFMVYGFSVICLCVFSMIFGESAEEFSSLFEMGNRGLSKWTLLQFLLVSTVIVLLRYLFFTDTIIKKASVTMRTIGMFASVILTVVVCVNLFGWFPAYEWKPWILFFICFGVSAGVSTAIFTFKEKTENKKMEEALKRIQKGENDEKDDFAS